jgi:hypothetical protein
MSYENKLESANQHGGVMRYLFILVMIPAMLPASLQAQDKLTKEDYAEWASVCVVAPVFHCTQHLEAGGAIGYFGYELQCPDSAPEYAEVYVDIGDDNQFSPGSKDRGQPKVFVSGEHPDEFEVELSMAEVEASSVVSWTVKGLSATVEYFKTKDSFLDCSTMSQ